MQYSKLALMTLLALSMASCKRDDEEDDTTTPTPVGTGTVKLSFTFMNGASPYDINTTVQDGAGHDVRFSTLKFYASDFHLTDDADVEVAEFHETVVLVDASASSNLFTLGAMSPSHVHEAHITLGLDATLNHADPTLAEYPLNLPDMHWSWNPAAGYKFLVLEGHVDGNGDSDFDDVEDLPITYHCATDALLRETHVHIHADVDAGATVTMQAKVDVAHLISGLDFLNMNLAMGGTAANITAMDSLVTAIDEL
ncbi:MAG: hypothetical protein IPL52_07090 [Flavobacteriales bacterium]|nr:hypothetical protein [Flavobacteriales bacterium]